jgi:hypothetical protein
LNIPISSNRIRFRITHFSTFANFLITEPDNTISFTGSDSEETTIIKLGICGNYGDMLDDLVKYLNKLAKDQSLEKEVEVLINISGIISLIVAKPPATTDFILKLLPMNHRVQSLLDLYDVDHTSLIC